MARATRCSPVRRAGHDRPQCGLSPMADCLPICSTPPWHAASDLPKLGRSAIARGLGTIQAAGYRRTRREEFTDLVHLAPKYCALQTGAQELQGSPRRDPRCARTCLSSRHQLVLPCRRPYRSCPAWRRCRMPAWTRSRRYRRVVPTWGLTCQPCPNSVASSIHVLPGKVSVWSQSRQCTGL